MERVCEELDEAKSEIEKLRAEVKAKAEVSATLKRAHYEQLSKIQEANEKIEKQAQELNEKVDEISVTKHMNEELKSCIKEKETVIKQLSTANDKLRTNSGERLKEWEQERKELVEKLDEANLKNTEQGQELNAYKEEIKGLKSLLSVSENNYFEAKKNAKALKESRKQDDMFYKLEEESRKVENQLKWKKEQFKHLEEAHERLRGQFQASRKEWEMEKSTLIDEISSLQENLESQTRISEGLQSRLQMCNQALAHEESRRKYIEVQLSEKKTCFDNVLAECEEAKSEIDRLTGQRDKDIASLRDLLGTKEMLYKEMKYRVNRLEQENEDLRLSLKEFQEAQIQEAATSSLSNLQNKLKSLEQLHKNCSKNLRNKEAEWASQLERMAGDLNDCRYELESKEEVIKDIKTKCEVVDQISKDCSAKLMAEEAEWTSQSERMAADLTNCRTELDRKNEVIKELETKCEVFDQVHRECSAKLSAKEAEWTSQLEKIEEDFTKNRTALESRDEVIKELKGKLELLDQMHRGCSANFIAKEAEWASQSEKMAGDLTDCRYELECKDDVIKELKTELNELKQMHGYCCSKLRAKESEWSYQSEKLAEELTNCRYELESKDVVIKELKGKLELLDQMHRSSSANFIAKEVEWASQSEKMAGDLTDCRYELECKDDVIKELKTELNELKQMHGYCCSKLRAKESEWSYQSEELTNCRYELESKDVVIKELKGKLELLDQMHRSSSANFIAKEAEWASQSEKMAGDLTDCRYKLERKDGVIEELKTELNELKQMHEDCGSKLRAKESEWSNQSEKMAKELADYRYELQRENDVVKQLKMDLDVLKQINRDCSAKLRAKEAEWTTQLGRMAGDLNECKTESESKDEVIKELQMALEDCHSLIMHLELKDEERSLLLMMLKLGISEALLRLTDDMADREHGFSLLTKELEMKSDALIEAKKCANEHNDDVASLFSKIDSLSSLEQEHVKLKDELERYKEVLMESDGCQARLKEKALKMESDFRKVHDALNKANDELADKFREGNELEFELQIWRCAAERLIANLEEFQKLRKELEASLLAQVEVEVTLKQEKENLVHVIESKDKIIDELQVQLMSLDRKLEARKTESDNEKEKAFDSFQEEIECLEQEALRRELEGVILVHTNAGRTFELERENFHRLMKEKDQRIDHLLQLLTSKEEKSKSSTTFLSLQLEKKQEELNLLLKAWEKIATDELAKEIEIQEKTLVIAELEDDLSNLQKKMDSQQKVLASTEKERKVLGTEIKATLAEVKKLTSDLTASKIIIDKFEIEKRTLLEDVNKLLSERESMWDLIGGLSERINSLSVEDMKLMGFWERILQNCDNTGSGIVIKMKDEHFDPSKENVNIDSSFTAKSVEATADGRSPLRALNF